MSDPIGSIGPTKDSICSMSVLGNFKSCDWSTRFMKVILLGLSLVRISWGHQTSTVAVRTSTFVHKLVKRLDLFVQLKTVPSTVCAPLVSCASAFFAGCTGDSLVNVYTNWFRGWIYVYSCITVPSTVCAPRVSTKTP